MKRIIYILLIGVGVMTLGACELDLQDDPNRLAPADADPDFLLTGIQVNTASLFDRASVRGMEVTRMENLGASTWENAYSATTFDAIWQDAYADIMVEALVLDAIAVEKEFYHHTGIAKVLSAYALVAMVDMFGEVPYSEAFDATNFIPNADGGAANYTAALALLDDAIADFAKTPLATADSDLFYEGDPVLWTTCAKTLKLRIHLQSSLVNSSSVAAINALLSENDLIDTDEEAFAFPYGVSSNDPVSQHPSFNNNYAGGANDYQSNSFMNTMYQSNDPRMRYYFYRQVTTDPTDITLKDCIGTTAPAFYGSDDAYCLIGDGYWGRDHLDDAGIPPDGQLRTVNGPYPAGGLFDADQGALVGLTDGFEGAGINPMIMPAFTEFMKAEAALTLGTSGDARTSLETGLRSSLNYVVFGFKGGAAASFVTDEAAYNTAMASSIDTYVANVLAAYDAAGSVDARLGVIVSEYYIALFGNGLDAYNTYRRTGHPKNMQPAVRNSNPGLFYRSFTYPASYVNRNSNATQKPNNAVQVFWDNNPAGFVD
jgi:hypothetical protein